VLRSMIAFNKKDMAGALIEIERAIELNPGLEEAYAWKGRVLQDMGELERALRAYQKALELVPPSADVIILHYNIGWIYNELHQFGRAYAHWKEVDRLQPQSKAFKERLKIMKQLAKELGQEIPKL